MECRCEPEGETGDDGKPRSIGENGQVGEFRARLDRVSDIERLAVKLAMDRMGPRELVSLRASLAELPINQLAPQTIAFADHKSDNLVDKNSGKIPPAPKK